MEKNEFGYYSFFSYFDRSIIEKEKGGIKDTQKQNPNRQK